MGRGGQLRVPRCFCGIILRLSASSWTTSPDTVFRRLVYSQSFIWLRHTRETENGAGALITVGADRQRFKTTDCTDFTQISTDESWKSTRIRADRLQGTTLMPAVSSDADRCTSPAVAAGSTGWLQTTVKLYSLLFTLYSTHHRADEHDAGSETIFRADCTDFTQISTDYSRKSARIQAPCRLATPGAPNDSAVSGDETKATGASSRFQ